MLRMTSESCDEEHARYAARSAARSISINQLRVSRVESTRELLSALRVVKWLPY